MKTAVYSAIAGRTYIPSTRERAEHCLGSTQGQPEFTSSMTFSNTLTEQNLPLISANSIEQRHMEEEKGKAGRRGEEERE